MLMKLNKFFLKYKKTIVIVFITLSMPLIYTLVYFTGGIKFVFSHTMYIPIILAGIFFGRYGGSLIGLVAGILLGPLMPLVVETGEPQTFINWGYRLVVFITIGFIGGYFSDFLNKKMAIITDMSSINPETQVPNINSILRIEDTNLTYCAFTIVVSDKSKISNVFGYDIFNKVMYLTYRKLISGLPKQLHIIQSDSNKFWIMYPDIDIQTASNEILTILADPVMIDDVNLFVEYYLGAEDAHTIDEYKKLLPFRESDRYALYAEEHNLPYVIFDEEIFHKRLQIDLLSQFRQALETEDIYLAYHPIVNLKTMEISGMEALIRWNHPEKGNIAPNDFIPLIENTQLIHPLTEWVLKKGIEKIIEFCKKNYSLRFSFNLSAKNFKDPLLFDKVKEIVDMTLVNSSNIRLEITETVLMDKPEISRATIEKLREIGISFAIDDFGRGYSSLAYLSQFDIKTIKIDRYFISRLSDKSIYEIVKATTNLAHQLGYTVVAEGIESIEQMNIMKELNCDYAQGFYFCRPIHQDKIMSYYEKNRIYEIKEKKSESSSVKSATSS